MGCSLHAEKRVAAHKIMRLYHNKRQEHRQQLPLPYFTLVVSSSVLPPDQPETLSGRRGQQPRGCKRAEPHTGVGGGAEAHRLHISSPWLAPACVGR